LHLTTDGVLVVLHDEPLDRTARPTEESAPGDCTGLVKTKMRRKSRGAKWGVGSTRPIRSMLSLGTWV
jgi:glycerophosphoryl diester phosphodiesterase